MRLGFFLKKKIERPPGNWWVLYHMESSGHALQKKQNNKKRHNPQYILTIQPGSQLRGLCNFSENTSMGEKVMTHLFTVACKHSEGGRCPQLGTPQFNSDLCALWYIIRSHVLTRLLSCQCNCRVFPEVRRHRVCRAAVAVATNMTLWDYGNYWMENILKH